MVLLTKEKGRDQKRALFKRQEGTGLAPASRASGFDIGVHRASVGKVLLQERVWRRGPPPGSAVPCCVTVEGWLTLSGPAFPILVKGNLMRPLWPAHSRAGFKDQRRSRTGKGFETVKGPSGAPRRSHGNFMGPGDGSCPPHPPPHLGLGQFNQLLPGSPGSGGRPV